MWLRPRCAVEQRFEVRPLPHSCRVVIDAEPAVVWHRSRPHAAATLLDMSDKQIALDLAAFLDSPFGRTVGSVPREHVRDLAEVFLAGCYDGLGKVPRLLDGDDVHELVVHGFGARLARKDARVEHVHEVLDALLDFIAATSVFTQAFEARRALAPACDELVELVRAGRNVPSAPDKRDPFVHGASKLGRNDPCSCGSGRKYKKCHGKES